MFGLEFRLVALNSLSMSMIYYGTVATERMVMGVSILA